MYHCRLIVYIHTGCALNVALRLDWDSSKIVNAQCRLELATVSSGHTGHNIPISIFLFCSSL